MTVRRAGVVGLAAALAGSPAVAQPRYDPGASDSEIRIGNIMPYSGPAAAYGAIGKTMAAYFDKVNAEGGINGRKVKFVSYDDAYSPPKTVEQARKLVESDEVLAILQPLGTAPNLAIQKYLNDRKVPQLFVATGATRFGDHKAFPWTMGWPPNYQTEGRIYARYILQEHPAAKVGILVQNDDYGRDLLQGLKDGLGDKAASLIVAEATYDVADPTINSQILRLKAAGTDVLVDIATPKFAAQAIRKLAEIGWKPVHIVNTVASSVGGVLKPAGLENAIGLISTTYQKDVTDPAWKDDPGVAAWTAFMDKYYPDGDRRSTFTVYGYSAAQAMVQILKQCGDDLTRANVMRQAASLERLALPMLLPGITVDTSPTDFYPIEQMQLIRFDGAQWQRFGAIIGGETRR